METRSTSYQRLPAAERIKTKEGAKMIIELYGEFGYFNCDKCGRKTRVEIDSRVLESYFCAYCGTVMSVTESTFS